MWPNTIIHEYDLVCSRSQLSNVAQSVYFAGLLVGVFGAGLASDRFGRKATLCPLVLGMAFFGTLAAFMPSVEAFIAVRSVFQLGHGYFITFFGGSLE